MINKQVVTITMSCLGETTLLRMTIKPQNIIKGTNQCRYIFLSFKYT